MAQNDANTPAEQRRKMKQQWTADAQESIEKYERELGHFRAFKARVKDADRDELKAMFGEVMSDARTHHRDVVEARIWFADDTAEDGEISKLASVPMSSHAYADVSPDLSFRVPCDAFLDYETIRQTAIGALGQAISGASYNLEDAQSRVERYEDDL